VTHHELFPPPGGRAAHMDHITDQILGRVRQQSLPIVWGASCTYGLAGSVNRRIAKIESVPVPVGSVVVEKHVAPWRLMGSDSILYRVPAPIEEAEAEMYRRLQEEGWVERRNGLFAHDGICVFVHMQIWLWTSEWSSSENTHLRISLAEPDEC